MNRSKRYRQLLSRCNALRSRFLPKKFSPTGLYSDRALDAARAYRLMVHAEIESYLEDRAREAAQNALTKWQGKTRLSKTLLALLAHHSSQTPLSGPLIQRVHHVTKTYIRSIEQNHGLKKSNILALLPPIGIEESELDPVWLTSMDAFGVQRGATAHQSSAPQLTLLTIDPQSEFSLVNQILLGVENVDDLINQLLKG